MTTTTQVPAAPSVSPYADFYDRSMLVRAVSNFVHNRWAQVRDIPANSGLIIKFRRYGVLAAATTALTEGVTPAGSALSITDAIATVLQYGDYVTLTDKVSFSTLDPILTETAEILGDQAGDTLDQLTRNVMVAGASVQYASTATAIGDITAAMKMNATEVREAVLTLQEAKAKPIMRMIDPSNSFNTVPVGSCYVGIIHPRVYRDLKTDTAWIPVEKYGNKSDVMEGEVGALDEVRFVMSPNAKVGTGLGNSADVYYTLIFGRDFYAITRISGEALKNIIKPLGSAGTNDPLDQRATSGWKATHVAKVLNATFGINVESGATA